MFHSIDLFGAKEIILSSAKFLSKKIVDPYNLFLDGFHVRYYKKVGQNLSSLEKLFHWKKFFLKNGLMTSIVIVRPACGPLQIVSWGLSDSISQENGAKNFYQGENSYFLKCLFLSTA